MSSSRLCVCVCTHTYIHVLYVKSKIEKLGKTKVFKIILLYLYNITITRIILCKLCVVHVHYIYMYDMYVYTTGTHECVVYTLRTTKCAHSLCVYSSTTVVDTR